ncbi:MAG: FHA domain-containing protein [Deltaproteobacteria bacterium]|jgi:pSer/pThr/pTyr-binding forkhead associated (FHA) protein|nr:FHA domain-containing protein [Deltaproteobacteria bacterium]
MFKLIQKSNPEKYHQTQKTSFLLGRSKQCDIVISDPKISDVQAKVGAKDNRYFIKNLGSAKISVNGQPTEGQFINNGDELALGKSKFVVQLAEKERPESKLPSMDDKTMVLDTPSDETLGPRLVCTTAAGRSKIIPLKREKLIIGRSNEATLKLMHPSISRKHCVIEKQDQGYVARNISTTNPLFLNDQEISEKRLYSGDQLRMGTFSITFISDQSTDARQTTQKIVTSAKRSNRSLWLTALLIFTFSGYLLYLHAYMPWKAGQKLAEIAARIEVGDVMPAQASLKELLQTDLSAENAQTAKDMLAQITLIITQQKAEKGDLKDAKLFLKNYLAKHGHGQEAQKLWDRLDFYRLTLGEQLESNNQHQSALREYSSIREDSLYFEEAQKAIRRIWLAYQQKSREKQNIAQLLKEAETHFLAKRYLTPVNKNAFSVYQAVLALNPKHELALQRIEQMKAFYREHGEGYYKKQNWSKALFYFERYSIIDSESQKIKAKITACRQKLMSTQKSTSASSASGSKLAKHEEEKKREEIQRLLEESGAESSRIMKYLFEEKEGEKETDTPW